MLTPTISLHDPNLVVENAGLHWSRIRGYNFKWGHRVIPDPRDPAKIFITTYGGSVWHGPAVGVPNALDDIVAPVLVAH